MKILEQWGEEKENGPMKREECVTNVFIFFGVLFRARVLAGAHNVFGRGERGVEMWAVGQLGRRLVEGQYT